MIVTCYRYYSNFRNAQDKILLVPPASSGDIVDDIRVVLPTGYTLGEDQAGSPKIYNEFGEPCELCLNNLKGTAILAVSSTRVIGMKKAPDGKVPVPLQEARLAANLTQQQLSEASGVNVRQIRRVESGESDAGNLTARNLIALADVLGVDPRSLI